MQILEDKEKHQKHPFYCLDSPTSAVGNCETKRNISVSFRAEIVFSYSKALMFKIKTV